MVVWYKRIYNFVKVLHCQRNSDIEIDDCFFIENLLLVDMTAN